MGQLDEVSQSIGKIQGTLEAHGEVHSQILKKMDDLQSCLTKKCDEYDDHIQRLDADLNERKGAQRVWVAVASFAGAGAVKLIEHIPKLFP